jgi:hypothetical protein
VDLDGLKKLQLMLAKYQGIVELMQPRTMRPPTEAAQKEKAPVARGLESSRASKCSGQNT